MPKPRANELSEAGRRGRNSKARGHNAERTLAKLLSNNFGLPVKRIARSGALKAQAEQMAGTESQYRGDLMLEFGKEGIRIEVKTRSKLPKYVTEVDNILEDYHAIRVNPLFDVMTLDNFVYHLKHKGVVPTLEGKTIKRTKSVEDWFKQDDSDIVMMKQTGRSKWYVAVKVGVFDRIGGRF
jgi:hypothetical protein